MHIDHLSLAILCVSLETPDACQALGSDPIVPSAAVLVLGFPMPIHYLLPLSFSYLVALVTISYEFADTKSGAISSCSRCLPI